jgi:hypothetical protein
MVPLIRNLQIVNHVRGDDFRVLAIFNLDACPSPCQLVADNKLHLLFSLGSRRGAQGIRWMRLSQAITDLAFKAYDSAMIELFSGDWRTLKDGSTRMLEWTISGAASETNHTS